LLTFTTLYPNASLPAHGIFVETRLRHLVASGQAVTRVVAPVPWFFSSHPRFGSYARWAAAPREESRHGLAASHPRYFLPPKVGMNIAPHMLARAGLHAVRRAMAEGYDFDLIDAHYFYPDGVAAAMIADELRKPLVITARGTDLNLIPRYPGPRRRIQWAAERADALITVCAALRDVLLELGVPEQKVSVLRNGVDLELFKPVDREAERRKHGLEGPTLISVGHLIDRKGHDLIISAMPALAGYTLLVVGVGERERALRALAKSLGVEARVRFLGELPQAQLKSCYGAVDALVLASSREGWPNVLLESMACGTPVVASPVWGTPEVVAAPEAGVLMRERTVGALIEAVQQLFSNYPARSATRRYAEQFSWEATTNGQLALFRGILGRRAA
jgi:glycosyltransferase involved in cell wall biosynthesis